MQDYFPLRGRSHEAAKQVHREGINIIVDELEACGMERFQIRSIFLRRIGWMGGDPSLASARCFDEHDCERHSALAAALSRLWGMYHSRPEPIHSVLRHLKSLESCGLYRLSTPTLPGDEPFFREKVIGLLAHGRIVHAFTALDILGNVVGARTTASWTDENKRSAILETLEQLFHEAFYLAFHVNQNILAAADLVTEFSWSTQVEKLGREELMVVHQAAAVLGHKFQPRLDIFASLFADPIPQTSE